MSIIALVAILIFLGVVLWAIRVAPFIDPGIKQYIYIAVVLATVFFLLKYTGAFAGHFNVHM